MKREVIFEKEKFQEAFKNNFYLTEEWANFCSEVTGIKLTERTILNKRIFLLKRKNISISNYDDKLAEAMKKEKISFMRVLPEVNSQSKMPSFLGYSLFLKKSYDEAVKNYKRSFRDALKQGRKYEHKLEILEGADKKLIKDIYKIYVAQMRRLNSFVFPISFLEKLIKLPSSLIFILKYNKKIIAYSLCFQYEDNLYASLGGGNPQMFKIRPSNKLYDELIKYACDNKLNLHLGIGERGAGFSLFKEKAGALNYKCERYPDDEKILAFLSHFLKFKLTGSILFTVSRLFPNKILYANMPFT